MADDKDDNLSKLPGANLDNIDATIAQIERDLPATLKYVKVLAKMRKDIYDAHREAGFTRGEALTIALDAYAL